MSIGQINPNVPSTVQVPDTYLYISTTPNSVTTDQPRNVFLVSTGILQNSGINGAPYLLSAGTATVNEIKQYSDVTRVNLAFGRKAPVSNRFRSAIQEVPIGVNYFLAAIQEPQNSGFAGFATALLTFAGTAQGSGEIRVRFCGADFAIPVANGDTAAIIAADCITAMARYYLDGPVVNAGLIGSATVALTYVVRGVDGNDFPILVSIPPEITGVTISPGTITITTTSIGHGGGASIFLLQCDSTTYATSIPASTTPTQAAALIVSEINSTLGPLSATYSAGVITLFYRSGWYVKKLQISSTEDATGQVYTLAARHNCGLPSILIATNATGSTFTITAAGVAKNVTITAAWTPTQSATAIAAALSGDATYPLNATSLAGLVSCTWRSTPSSVSVSATDATQTYTLTFPAAITMVATTPGSASLTGLPGAGDPTLTALLANKAKQPAMIEWAVDYLDATSTSDIYDHVEQYGDGFFQQNQRVTYVSTDPLETAAAVATSATPNLGNSWRYSVGVYQGAACQGGAYGAQVAARLAATNLPFNMDGLQLQVGTIAPMLPGRSETDLDPTSQDVALGQDHLFPLVGVNGVVTVVRGKTCWTASNTEWGDWSFGRIYDLIRFQLRVFLNARFKGKVQFFGGGVIRVPNGFRPIDVKNAIGEYLDAVDGSLIDGAKNLKQYIVVEPYVPDRGRLNIYFQVAVPRELHVLAGVIGSI